MNSVKRFTLVTVTVILAALPYCLTADDGITVSTGADLTSRYIWRGTVMNDGPNVQPSITLGLKGFELGLWGSSTVTNNNTTDDFYAISQEVDFWMGYSHEFESGAGIGVLITDYYFPKAGVRIGNFNNHDDAEGAGAHTIEAGVSLTGPSSFPVTLSAYRNVYNEAGNNNYFQLDYSAAVKDVGLDFFIGAAGGSKKNPGYYGTDSFNIINLGLTVTKSIKITDSFSLPASVSYIVNPRIETGYLIFGISL